MRHLVFFRQGSGTGIDRFIENTTLLVPSQYPTIQSAIGINVCTESKFAVKINKTALTNVIGRVNIY